MPKLITDWIRVCTSGVTADKRTIEPQMLKDAAASYDPNQYEARIYPIHLYDWSYDRSPIGDVVELQARDENGGTALYARLRPNAQMVAINQAEQLCYPSVELDPQFADTGKAYLRGIALTDAPACLGVERIQLSAQQSHLLVGEAEAIQLSALTPKPEGVFSRLAAAFSPNSQPKMEPQMTTPSDPHAEQLTQLSQQVTQLGEALVQLQTKLAAPAPQEPELTAAEQVVQLTAKVAELEQQLAEATKVPEAAPAADAVTQLTAQVTQMQAQLTQLSALAPNQLPNPAGIGGDHQDEDVL
ncbi:GPO family capsid scaffolding protein [Ferrimonas senticii]|uniref:GPO family capsid scaffolding protein n=1 Tax=Ferrimonas senticii TaxID=394566 RepID=UPI00146B361B|nr:GPO family capsid scaffolding protein [Ferrimonas senticii]